MPSPPGVVEGVRDGGSGSGDGELPMLPERHSWFRRPTTTDGDVLSSNGDSSHETRVDGHATGRRRRRMTRLKGNDERL